MTQKYTKHRISVPFSEPLYNLIMEQANIMGVSASYYIANIVGTYMINSKSVIDGMKDILREKITTKEGAEND